jgi:hypothetical protein
VLAAPTATVPVITPVVVLIERPEGMRLALYHNVSPSGSVAAIARVTASPAVFVRGPGFATTGGRLAMPAIVHAKLRVVEAPLLSITVTVVVKFPAEPAATCRR